MTKFNKFYSVEKRKLGSIIWKKNSEKVIDINKVIQAKRVEFESFKEILIIASANLLSLNNSASLIE